MRIRPLELTCLDNHSVFPFGVNDPSVGNLSSEHAPWDTIASPAGWHSFPDSKNPWVRQSIPGMKTGQTGPFVNGSRFAEEYEEASAPGNGTKELWSTFMTTMGNNVLAQESVVFIACDMGDRPEADTQSLMRYRDWEGASNWLHNDRPVNSSYIFDYEYGEPDGLRPKEYM
jgi:extracellular elastinolytic metalloproteinase